MTLSFSFFGIDTANIEPLLCMLRRAFQVAVALAYLNYMEAGDYENARNALRILKHSNWASAARPITGMEMPPLQILRDRTARQLRMYMASMFDHDGSIYIWQTLLPNQHVSVKVHLHCLRPECTSGPPCGV